jgi:cation diffusion facilitator CzcD-associated flavoprotein CzcO
MDAAHDEPRTTVLDVAVVGAGFSGLYLLHRLRAMGLAVKVFDKADGVGGTWHWNRYPGARCDIESFDYCYSFSPQLLAEWRWTERYATQPEILRYLDHVADRLDLRRDIVLRTEIIAARFDAEQTAWVLETGDGDELTARYCVLAIGNLSAVQEPAIPGLDTFTGARYHTARWPTGRVDLVGRRVAVLGTGSSGIQTVTAIAPSVERLFVLQRTPNYSMPAQNRTVSEAERDEVLAGWDTRRRLCEESDAGTPLPPPTRRAVDVTPAEREAAYEEGWRRGGISALSGAFSDMFTSEASNAFAQDFARRRIREIVKDPRVADLLCPHHHIGTKRTCVDTGYFEIFNRDNVELVDLRRSPIQEANPGGIRTSERQIDVDVIVFATGFDAITGAFDQVEIRGRDGVRLSDRWSGGPRTLLGLQTVGFPNLFFVTGPGSPSVLSNMVVSIEQHVDWIARCLQHLRECGAETIEPTPEAEDRWMSHVDALANATLYPRASSWYVGANVPGKPRRFTVYVAGCGPFRHECDDVAADGYRGFTLSGTPGRERRNSSG